MDYVNFLERRQRAAGISGFDTCFMPEMLFPFQQSLVDWAVAKGRAALFADCGLGKSFMELTFAQNVVQHTNRHVLLLTPIAVGSQMAEEAKRIGVEAKVCREGIYHRNPHVVITNYERLHLFDPAKFAGIVCDECFPPETEVETLKHGCIVRTAIKDIRNGDEIYNASGRDRVVEIHRRKIDRAIKISVGGRIITSSENHPVFTQRGWVPAFGLLEGDSILETSAAVRLVSDGVLPVVSGDVEWSFLRDILLSEMADAPEVCDSLRPFGGGEKEKIGVKECMVQDPGSRGREESHYRGSNCKSCKSLRP